jgi:hypothetical protein
MVVMRLEMGLYRVTVEATGGHGCQREIGKDEGVIFGCRRMDCPDCITQEYVAKMKAAGQAVSKAEFIHWPNAEQWGGLPIVDEYVGPLFTVGSYKTSDGGEQHYPSVTPIHRIRHGFFGEHKKGKEWLEQEKAKRAESTESK